ARQGGDAGRALRLTGFAASAAGGVALAATRDSFLGGDGLDALRRFHVALQFRPQAVGLLVSVLPCHVPLRYRRRAHSPGPWGRPPRAPAAGPARGSPAPAAAAVPGSAASWPPPLRGGGGGRGRAGPRRGQPARGGGAGAAELLVQRRLGLVQLHPAARQV